MSPDKIKDLYALLLSGAAEIVGDLGIKTEDDFGQTVYVKFINNNPRHYRLAYCDPDEKLQWEMYYKNGVIHGKSRGWDDRGRPTYEDNFKHGRRHGKSIDYWDGEKFYEAVYKKGIKVKEWKLPPEMIFMNYLDRKDENK